MKKFFVIIVLFALPLVAYLFFASGVNHFARLPILDQKLYPLQEFETLEGDTLVFDDNITILSFPGKQPMEYLTYAYHIAEKIYDPYSGFKDFRFVSVLPEGNQEEVRMLKKKLAGVIDMDKWKFVTGSPQQVEELFNSLGSDLDLGPDLFTPNVFIIDKKGQLRGRKDDEDVGRLYGYDAGSIAILNNKMNDDVKVILAEYRLELKKYKEDQKK